MVQLLRPQINLSCNGLTLFFDVEKCGGRHCLTTYDSSEIPVPIRLWRYATSDTAFDGFRYVFTLSSIFEVGRQLTLHLQLVFLISFLTNLKIEHTCKQLKSKSRDERVILQKTSCDFLQLMYLWDIIQLGWIAGQFWIDSKESLPFFLGSRCLKGRPSLFRIQRRLNVALNYLKRRAKMRKDARSWRDR